MVESKELRADFARKQRSNNNKRDAMNFIFFKFGIVKKKEKKMGGFP